MDSNEIEIVNDEVKSKEKSKKRAEVGEKKKNPHEKHRKRLLASALNDVEFESMSDFQVLEFFLGFFVPRKDTNVIAHDLIDKFYSVYGACTASPEELFQVKNMTKKAAYFMSFLIPFCRRAEITRIKIDTPVENSHESAEILRPYLTNRESEHFYLMMLDLNNRIIGINSISKGTATLTSIQLDMMFSRITRAQAVKVIVAHNHPAGNLMPSDADIATTKHMNIVLNGVNKELLDHIIFTNEGYYSFYENDKMLAAYMASDKFMRRKRAREVSLRDRASHYILEPDEIIDENDVGKGRKFDDSFSVPYPKKSGILLD